MYSWGRVLYQGPTQSRSVSVWALPEHQIAREARVAEVLSTVTEAFADLKPAVPPRSGSIWGAFQIEHQTAREARLAEVLSDVTKAFADLKPAVARAVSGSSTVSDAPFRKSPSTRASFEDKISSVSDPVASSASRTFKTPILQSTRFGTHQSLQKDGFVCSGASKTRQTSQNSGVFHAGDTATDSVYENLTPGPGSATLTMSPAPMRPKCHGRYSTVAPGNSVHELSKALHSSEEQQIQKTSGSSKNILQTTPKRFMVFRWFDSFVCWISGLLLMRVAYSLSRRECTDKVYSEWYNSLCYVPVSFCGFEQMHYVLVDTAASRGMISHDLAREYNLEITPTMVRIEGFNSDRAPTFATEEAAAHIEYNNKPFQVTFLILQNPRYPLILPRSMLLAAGIVKFGDGVMHEKLPWSDSVMSPLVASRDTRRWRTVRELLFRRGKKVPDQKEVKLRRLRMLLLPPVRLWFTD